MNLLTQGVRIIVREPKDWCHGNLFGYVLDQHDNHLFIKLSHPIREGALAVDVIELEPRYPGETFKPLEHYFTVPVKGALINSGNKESDIIVAGTVTIE